MPTRDDYERLISHEMKEGDIVRVPMRDDSDYHAQRMVLFRLIKTMKSQGIDVNNIATRKHTKGTQVFLELEHLSKDDPKFIFITPDGEEERTISRSIPTREDLEFENWMASVRKLKTEEDD